MPMSNDLKRITIGRDNDGWYCEYHDHADIAMMGQARMSLPWEYNIDPHSALRAIVFASPDYTFVVSG